MNNDVTESDQKLDESILAFGMMDEPLLSRILVAIKDGDADKTNWAKSKLDLFRERVNQSKLVEIIDPETKKGTMIADLSGFEAIYKKFFPSDT